MKFKLDENLPAELADDLASFGHDADTVDGKGLKGASDAQVLLAAREVEADCNDSGQGSR